MGSLSQENIDKLDLNGGVYRCEPVLEWLPEHKRNDPYWCRNWTFRPREYNGEYYMHDTYWSGYDSHPIKLSDENFDRFEYLFNFNDIRFEYSYQSWSEYPEENRWICSLDSGGRSRPKFVVHQKAHKVKDSVVARLMAEIDTLTSELEYKKETLDRVINDEVDIDYV